MNLATILPLQNMKGVYPQNFPPTRGALQELTNDECDYFILFYNLQPVAGNEHSDLIRKLENLKNHLGNR
jgi:hypothetical protein